MSNMGDRVLKNHDEIVRIKAVLDTNYRPLIENTSGQPTNLLTRLATLESSVEALEMEKLKEQETNMQGVRRNRRNTKIKNYIQFTYSLTLYVHGIYPI